MECDNLPKADLLMMTKEETKSVFNFSHSQITVAMGLVSALLLPKVCDGLATPRLSFLSNKMRAQPQ